MLSPKSSKKIKWVKKEELTALREWCLHQFGARYGDVIDESFHRLALA